MKDITSIIDNSIKDVINNIHYTIDSVKQDGDIFTVNVSYTLPGEMKYIIGTFDIGPSDISIEPVRSQCLTC